MIPTNQYGLVGEYKNNCNMVEMKKSEFGSP